MSGSNSAISRRRLLKGAGAMWLLSVSQVGLAATSQVVAVRVWPSSTYTRVTVESNRVLKYKQFALSNPERIVVDLEGVNLNSVLKGMAAQIRIDSAPQQPLAGRVGYIASVAEFTPKTVQTEELRSALVYEVRVHAQDPQDQLRLGMPATVTIDLAGAPRVAASGQ